MGVTVHLEMRYLGPSIVEYGVVLRVQKLHATAAGDVNVQIRGAFRDAELLLNASRCSESRFMWKCGASGTYREDDWTRPNASSLSIFGNLNSFMYIRSPPSCTPCHLSRGILCCNFGRVLRGGFVE